MANTRGFELRTGSKWRWCRVAVSEMEGSDSDVETTEYWDRKYDRMKWMYATKDEEGKRDTIGDEEGNIQE